MHGKYNFRNNILTMLLEQDVSLKEAEKIADSILKIRRPLEDIGFFSGESGVVFFLSMLGSIKGREKYLDAGIDLLLKIHKEVVLGKHTNPTFSGGVAGYSWMLEYFSQERIIDLNTENLLEEVDDFLYMWMIKFLNKGNFDFLHGAGGIVLYFIRRMSAETAPKDKIVCYLNQAVEYIETLGKHKTDIVFWETLFNEYSLPAANISLSHGTSSVVVILCKLINENICKERCNILLKKAVAYLHSNRRDGLKHGSFFPTYSLDVPEPAASRLAWCYGDLGIMNSLQMAGLLLNDNFTLHAMEEVSSHLKTRRNLVENKVEDACICHGTTGVALYAYLVYQRDSNEANKDFLSFWLNATLKMGRNEDGVAGYMYQDNRIIGGKRELTVNFLQGLSGVGTLFALHSQPDDKNLRWLESLLLC